MKLNKIIISMGLALICTSTASFAETTEGEAGTTYAGSPTTGKISVEGTLVNAACALKSSGPVHVSFDEVTVSSLKNAQTVSQQKEIELDCDTTVATHATVTYTPNSLNVKDTTLAAITGSASGVGIGLKDNANQPVVWGTASSPVNLSNGKSVIPFTAFLKADSATGTVVPGDFAAQINFQIDYQ